MQTINRFKSRPSIATSRRELLKKQRADRLSGAWRLQRGHPLYLAAFMIWLSLGMAYFRLLPLVGLALYVVPIYLLYIREEEQLMIGRYGDAYRAYRERVGGLLPRRRP